MPIKLKKTNIQNDMDNPDEGYIIFGVDEDGNLVKKDENGLYEKVIRDETYGIYIKLESDYLTVGNRIKDSSEGLYSYSQGEYNESNNYISYSRGQYLKASGMYSYVSGKGYGNSINNELKFLHSSGLNSFVHSYSTNAYLDYGTESDYSVILGGINNQIRKNCNNSTIIGGNNNIILDNISNTTIIGGSSIVADTSNTVYVTNLNIKSGLTLSNLNSIDILTESITATDLIISQNSIISEGLIYAGGFKISNNTNRDNLLSNGEIDTKKYLCVTGGTITGNLINNGLIVAKTSIVSSNNLSYTNVVIGGLNFYDVQSIQLPNVSFNTIIGWENTRYLTNANNNIILGNTNALFTNLGGQVTNLTNNIIIGKNIKLSNNSNNKILIGNVINTDYDNNTAVLGSSTITKTILHGNILPNEDGQNSLGSLIKRWDTVYTTSDVITTSDANLKTNVRSFEKNESNAAKQLIKEIGLYKFLDAIELKGESAREHIGLTVQRVIQIMELNNLNPYNYAFICRDLKQNLKQNDLETYVYGFRYNELILFIIKGVSEYLNDIDNRLLKLETTETPTNIIEKILSSIDDIDDK